jgi:hypothetical protein
MSCPVCGANCKCRKAGPGGICCSCHKHKARQVLETIPAGQSKEIVEAIERHIRDVERERDSQLFRENGDGA